MWGKKDKMGFSAGGVTLISRSTEIVGDVHFTGNLEIEGRVKGNIIAEPGSDGRVRVQDKGSVTGEIQAPTIVINGLVNGDVFASKHIELAARAVVHGDVHYQVIEMVKGAQVNGNLVFSGADKQEKESSGHKNIKPVSTEPVAAST